MLTSEEVKQGQCVREPTPRQKSYLACDMDEVLVGGAAGSGKSDWLLVDSLGLHQDALLWPRYRSIIFRKTFTELEDLIDRSKLLYPHIYPGAEYNKSDHCWNWPSGSRSFFAYMESDDDRIAHQGKSYQYVGWDELTHWGTPLCYLFLLSRTRSTNPKIKPYTRATTNPGGRGHSWVKNWWRISNDGKPIQFRSKLEVMVNDKLKTYITTRAFIPGKLHDNPHLVVADPGYERNLAMQSEGDRKRLLEGRWDVVDGQFFTEFSPMRHIVKPFQIPDNWSRWISGDWGYSRPYSFGWYAMDPDTGCIYRYKELYGWGGADNVGTKESPSQVSMKIHQRSQREIKRGIEFKNNILDHNCWYSRGEEVTISEMFLKNGLRFNPSKGGKGSRVNRWNICNERLTSDSFKVFSNCVHFIRTVPNIQVDKNNPEDVDTQMEDHIVDEWGMSIVSRHNSIPKEQHIEKVGYMTYDWLMNETGKKKTSRSKYRLYS